MIRGLVDWLDRWTILYHTVCCTLAVYVVPETCPLVVGIVYCILVNVTYLGG